MNSIFGPLFVVIGASLWATDALFRYPILQSLNAELIVMIEHLIALIFLLPFFYTEKAKYLALKKRQWMGVCFIGVFSSAVATILFTKAFLMINPSIVILLQKLQPIVVTLLAVLFLKERPRLNFLIWAPIALISAMVLSFPNLDFLNSAHYQSTTFIGALLAIAAAVLWALGTVIGKSILKNISPGIVTFWRFWFGLSTLVTIQVFTFKSESVVILQSLESWRSLAYMAIVPGVVGVWLYYEGLKRTPAFIATFLELAFPITAVVLNTYFLDLPLTMTQILAGTLLLLSITAMNDRRSRRLGKKSNDLPIDESKTTSPALSS